MDLLKNIKGFSILETLVGILIIGFILIFFALFFDKMFNNPKILLRGEAICLANQEIDNAVNVRSVTDTSYTNAQGNLKIYRKVRDVKDLFSVEVKVTTNYSDKEILSLKAYYK